MLSIALAFIPEDDTVTRTVLQIDSKVVPIPFTYDKLWASMMKAVPKLKKSQSGQMVFE